eukprot:1157401-Pelagomonas_calceolata.AAC.6
MPQQEVLVRCEEVGDEPLNVRSSSRVPHRPGAQLLKCPATPRLHEHHDKVRAFSFRGGNGPVLPEMLSACPGSFRTHCLLSSPALSCTLQQVARLISETGVEGGKSCPPLCCCCDELSCG